MALLIEGVLGFVSTDLSAFVSTEPRTDSDALSEDIPPTAAAEVMRPSVVLRSAAVAAAAEVDKARPARPNQSYASDRHDGLFEPKIA